MVENRLSSSSLIEHVWIFNLEPWDLSAGYHGSIITKLKTCHDWKKSPQFYSGDRNGRQHKPAVLWPNYPLGIWPNIIIISHHRSSLWGSTFGPERSAFTKLSVALCFAAVWMYGMSHIWNKRKRYPITYNFFSRLFWLAFIYWSSLFFRI